jgi:hypothetical protein
MNAAFAATTSWHNRGQSKKAQRDVHVDVSHNKVAALYSLYLTSLRLARRRLLGMVNYLYTIHQWISGLHALVCAPDIQMRDKVEGVDEQGVSRLLMLQHTYSVDSDGILSATDYRGVSVVYQQAVTALGEVEDRMLRVATYFIKEAETRGIVNKLSVLHDMYQCELAFHEAKTRHVTLLIDLMLHAADSVHVGRHLEAISTALHLEPCLELGTRYFAGDYEQHVTLINKQSDFIRQVTLTYIHALNTRLRTHTR